MFRNITILIAVLIFSSFQSHGAEKDTFLIRINGLKDSKKQVRELNAASEKSWKTGKYMSGLIYAHKGLEVARKHKYRRIEAILLDNIGIIYDYKGNYPLALKNFFEALKIQEDINDVRGEAYTLSNIGLIYGNQDNNKQALVFHKRSLALRKKSHDKSGAAASYNNIGICHLNTKNYSKALFYFQKSKDMDVQMKDSVGLMDDLNNIGLCYMHTKRVDKAISCFEECLAMRLHFDDLFGAATAYNNIATCYSTLGDNDPAEKYFLTGLQMAKEIGAKESIWYSYENLAEIYFSRKDFKKAYEYQHMAYKEKNELTNAGSIREETETELNYQFAKKTEAENMRQVKKDVEDQERRKQSQILLWSMVSILFLIVFFLLVLFRRWKVATEQKKIIELQRHEVQEKNNEIVDSINYAQRIQTAILPSKDSLDTELKAHGLFFRPKDIVAGDFYWTHTLGDTVFFAVADCTGHGVPGAFMSILCHNALNRSIIEYNCVEPGKILDQARDIIVEYFAKSQMNLRDGMDISFCAWNKKTNEYLWAGANNPLWIIHPDENELIEIKGDKQPVGNHHQFNHFTTHKIELKEGSRIFLFSDGIADQFGEQTGKKYKSKRLKELILNTSNGSIKDQIDAVTNDFNQWIGAVEQIDDVCLLIVEF